MKCKIIEKKHLEVEVSKEWRVLIEIEALDTDKIYLGYWLKKEQYSMMSFIYGHYINPKEIDFSNDNEIVKYCYSMFWFELEYSVESYEEDIECLEAYYNEKYSHD